MFLCDPLAPRHKVALHPVDMNATDWHHLKLIIRQCDDYFARQHFEVQFDLKKRDQRTYHLMGCWRIIFEFIHESLPSLSVLSGLAPKSNSNCTTSNDPCHAATWIGLRPSWSLVSGSAPRRRINFDIS